MQYYDIILLSLALAVDALIVSFSYGLVIKHHRLKNALGLGVSTGMGQFLMPLLGFLLTGSIHAYVEQCDHWIAFAVFFILGARVIYCAFANKNSEDQEHIAHKLSFKILFITGVATSIDAFVAGASPYFSRNSAPDSATILAAALIIGGITFACSFLGFLSARKLHKLPSIPLEVIAGLVLIGLGVKILVEHTC